MNRLSFRIGAILASSVLFFLCARLELPWTYLGWIAMVPWLASLDRERSWRALVGNSVLMSMAFSLAVFAWLAEAIAAYTAVPVPLAYGVLVLTAPVLQPQFIGFALVRRLLVPKGAEGLTAAAAGAAAWVATETVVPNLLGDTLGHGVYPSRNLRQFADVAGAGGLTFCVVFVNSALLVAFRNARSSPRSALRAFAVVVLVLGSLAGYGRWRLARLAIAHEPGRMLDAALVQASLGDYGDLRERAGTFGAARRILDAHMSLTRAAIESHRDLDLIIWPETVYPTTFGRPKTPPAEELDQSIRSFVGATGVPLFFGTYDREEEREYNAAVLLSPDGVSEVYRKRRPFPLTEYVPSFIDSPRLREWLPWLGSWSPGLGPPVLVVPGAAGHVDFGPLICLDAVDPALALEAARGGSRVLVTLSNDGWFAGGAGARLHLVVSAFRSIETRLPQLRSTNSGISAVIAPDGSVVARAGPGEETVLVERVRLGPRSRTWITDWGDWFGPFSVALTLLLIGVAVWRRRVPG